MNFAKELEACKWAFEQMIQYTAQERDVKIQAAQLANKRNYLA